jgi:uncharacterized protein (TIGR00369 family)
MKANNPNYQDRITRFFADARFGNDLGIRLVRVEPGFTETELTLEERHQQQDGLIHAGVLATLADHTAGSVALTLAPADQQVVTVEFKINFLRKASGERLRCSAKVLKPGRTLLVVESEVYAEQLNGSCFVAKATVTLAVVNNGEETVGEEAQ